MVTSVDPVMPVPETSAGASAVTGRTANGERAVVPSSPVHVMKPVAHCSTGASALLIVTSNDCCSPAAPKVRLAGETDTSTPGIEASTV